MTPLIIEEVSSTLAAAFFSARFRFLRCALVSFEWSIKPGMISTKEEEASEARGVVPAVPVPAPPAASLGVTVPEPLIPSREALPTATLATVVATLLGVGAAEKVCSSEWV